MAAALPVLQRHLDQLRAKVREAPETAAGAMAKLVQETRQTQAAPTGEPFAPVQPYSGNVTGKFDPAGHVAGSYKPVVRGDQALVVADHPAAGILRKGRGGLRPMPGRSLRPADDGSVGWWLERIRDQMRRLFGG